MPRPSKSVTPPAAARKSGWSLHFGSIAGIELRVHATFFMLLAWIATRHILQGQSWAATLATLASISAVFVLVVLHELSHALMARRFGIRTQDITLLPIGGVARLERIPEKPREEFLVAIAGPAFNAALAAVLFGVLAFLGRPLSPSSVDGLSGGSFLLRMAWINVSLAVFNLIPAFPMDGGRVLRALLAMRLARAQATAIAAVVGQMLAFAVGLFGLVFNPMLVIIAVFVWMGAKQEAGAEQTRSALAGRRVQEAMMTDFTVLSPETPLSVAVEKTLRGAQHDFPVVDDGGRPIGTLTREILVKHLAESGMQTEVGRVMAKDVVIASPDDPLEDALPRLESSESHTLFVTSAGRLVGIVDAENVVELMLFTTALKRQAQSV